MSLTWPIFIEMLLRNALNMTDIFMLSGYSDLAVSAVGVISQIIFFLIVISMMVSSGTGILIAQFNGASQYKKSEQVGVASIVLSLLVGGLLSVGVFLGAETAISLYGLEDQVAIFATDYLLISGLFTFNITLGVLFSTVLRAHGFSKEPMLINLGTGFVNVIGNYIALYQPFGLPVFGVPGVAVATVVSQIIGTFAFWFVLKRRNVSFPIEEWKTIPLSLYKKILKYGVMNGSELLSYNLAQMVIVYFVVKMGTASLAAFVYAQNIARISFTFSLALGQAGQIQTGYFVGKGWIREISEKVHKYFLVGLVSSVFLASMFYLFRKPIISLFTEDPEIVPLLSGLIAGSILLEAGRVFNLIYISALKGAGDVKFPVQIGIVCMWGLGVCFSYLLGIYFGFGVLGAWLAIAMDEWVRGVIVTIRWKAGSWTRYSENLTTS